LALALSLTLAGRLVGLPAATGEEEDASGEIGSTCASQPKIDRLRTDIAGTTRRAKELKEIERVSKKDDPGWPELT